MGDAHRGHAHGLRMLYGIGHSRSGIHHRHRDHCQRLQGAAGRRGLVRHLPLGVQGQQGRVALCSRQGLSAHSRRDACRHRAPCDPRPGVFALAFGQDAHRRGLGAARRKPQSLPRLFQHLLFDHGRDHRLAPHIRDGLRAPARQSVAATEKAHDDHRRGLYRQRDLGGAVARQQHLQSRLSRRRRSGQARPHHRRR